MINEETNFRRTVRVKSHNNDAEETNNYYTEITDVNYDQIRKKSVGAEDSDLYDIFMKVCANISQN